MRLIISIIFATIACSGAQGQNQMEVEARPVRKLEEFAKFPGSPEKFYDYIKANLQYPKNALRDSITGDVFIEFVINSKGEVVQESVKVIKSLDPECDEEAVRLIKNSPRWIPARAEGKDVEQHVSFPVSFRLPE